MTQQTMRQLLERWAAVEPEYCKNQNRHSFTRDEVDDNFYVRDGDESGWGWHLVLSDSNPADEEGYYPYKRNALMHIQIAVQEAITTRGWGFELTYFNILGSYNAEIDIDERISFNRPGNSAPEALLTVYLRALEETNKKAG